MDGSIQSSLAETDETYAFCWYDLSFATIKASKLFSNGIVSYSWLLPIGLPESRPRFIVMLDSASYK